MWNDNWSIMKPTYFIILFSFNINFRFSIKWYSREGKYTCSMETVRQNGRFALFSSKFPSNIYSILFGYRLDRREGYKGPSAATNRGGGCELDWRTNSGVCPFRIFYFVLYLRRFCFRILYFRSLFQRLFLDMKINGKK